MRNAPVTGRRARVANSGGYGHEILVVVESGLCDHGVYIAYREDDVNKNLVRREGCEYEK